MPGLYLHIPFCSVKCHFCDFTAFSGQSRAVTRYLDALIKEGEARRAELPAPNTLYIGGGTPSELTAGELKRLLGWLRTEMVPGTISESTFEANPESLTEDKLEVLKGWGLTRVSIGLQAAQDRLLKGLGRQHDVNGFLHCYSLARKAIPEVNIDLMFALPGQTLGDWAETLDLVVGLQPEHISLYGLRVEERTVFSKKGVEADEDLGADMYAMAVERLKAAGFHHYEISNFARPGMESRHNIGYWSDDPYLGLGCGATSFIGGVRKTNAATLDAYCKAIEAGRSAIVDSEKLEGKERLGEQLLLGLRQVDGIDLTDAMRRDFSSSFERLQTGGLLEITGGHARLTLRGLLVANQVFQEFVAPFN